MTNKYYTGQQRFCPMRKKKVCFGCIFGRWIQTCFQNFSITHTFRSRLKGWNLLRQDTNVFFYHVHHKEFKYSFSQEDGVVFCSYVCSVMEVLVREYNLDQWRLFIDSSKVSLKVVLLHNGNRFPSVPLAHTANTMKFMKAWSYGWERLSMTNLSGSNVVIRRLWHCYSECISGTQNAAVSYASWTTGTKRITMQINCSLNEHHWRQGRKMSSVFFLSFRRTFYCPFCTKSWASWKTLWKVWITPAVDSNMWGTSSQMWVTQKWRRVYV